MATGVQTCRAPASILRVLWQGGGVHNLDPNHKEGSHYEPEQNNEEKDESPQDAIRERLPPGEANAARSNLVANDPHGERTFEMRLSTPVSQEQDVGLALAPCPGAS